MAWGSENNFQEWILSFYLLESLCRFLLQKYTSVSWLEGFWQLLLSLQSPHQSAGIIDARRGI